MCVCVKGSKGTVYRTCGFKVEDEVAYEYEGSIPVFSNVRKQKEKRLKNKDAIFFSRD
jgi:hypothetical protein